jgi:membrane protease YdiL (CAAX protease family)
LRQKFHFTMTRGAHTALLVFLLMYTVGLPLLIDWHAAEYPGVFTSLQYNMAYVGLSFTAALALGFRYLRTEFDTLLDNKLLNLFTLIQGYFLNTVLSYFLLLAVVMVMGENLNWVNPNNENIVGMSEGDVRKVLGMTVFLAPVAEEVLFRGAVFGWLREKDRAAAYIVSMTLFAVLHVWQYALAAQDMSVLLYALDYLPAGFVLAWCYDRTGSVWTSILMHMGINLNALSLLYY